MRLVKPALSVVLSSLLFASIISLVPLSATARSVDTHAEPCALSDKPAELQDLLQKHMFRRFSRSSIECAYDAALALQKLKLNDSAALGTVALTAANYLEYTDNMRRMDLMGVNAQNNSHHEKAASAVKETIAKYAKRRLLSATDQAWHGLLLLQYANAVTGSLDDTAAARELMEQAVNTQYDVLDGLALMVLGRVYYVLPAAIGGDMEKSIRYLERAVTINPQSAPALQYLAESYDQELEEGRAKKTLARLLEVKPTIDTQQEYADALRIAIGLSKRLSDRKLAKRLDERRKQLFVVNPELLTRQSEAIGGHGGVNPMTGE